MKKLYFSLIILCLSALTQQGFAQSAPTVYSTPGAYTYTVGTGVSLIGVDVRGAQGGNGSWSNGTGGTGGRVQANIAVSPGQVLYLYVGSQPAASACGSGGAAGSSFGGGEDGGFGSSYYGQCGGAGGGAASDIRTVAGSTTAALNSRLVVGAGGGGSGYDCGEAGGNGGGTTGSAGNSCGGTNAGYCGTPGTISGPGLGATTGPGSPGTFGGGGNCYSGFWGGGGGAGYYGAGGAYGGSAGGGSSYPATGTVAGGVSAVTNTGGYQSGNGYISIQVLCNASGAITGTPSSMCIGASVTLANTTAGITGTWVSGNPSVATINSSTGLVTGVSAGSTVITYNIASPCSALATATINVNPSPGPITGVGSGAVCTGLTLPLSETGSGTWASSNPAAATVSSTGLVSGAAPGVTTISYTLLTGCAPATTTITVNSNPAAISGVSALCVGASSTFTDGTSSGAWSSSIPAAATVVGGVVTGVSAGTTTISYTLTNGCYTAQPVTINPSPSPITGVTAVCVGATTTLSDATSGGSWTSSNPALATINAGSGLMTGVFAGSPTMIYTLSGGTHCSVSIPVVVNPLPGSISGSGNVCVGSTTTLTDGGTGTWFTSAPSIASIGVGSGIVTGISGGTATITYTLTTGCSITAPMVVNALPTAYAVNGGGNYCSSVGGVHVGLVFGASGINYQLSLAGSGIGSPVPGSNSSLDFGLESGVGTYTVIGTNPLTGCSSNMTGSVHVGVNPSPNPHTITGGGGYCVAGAGSLIGVDGSDAGISYQLFNGSTLSTTLAGTGSGLSFGSFTTPGTYTVTALNASSGCSLVMSGTATVYTFPAVNPYPVSGGGGFCPGGTGPHVTLPNSDATVSYQLYYNGVVSGLPVPGTPGFLDFGPELLAGTYTVVATDGSSGCQLNMPGSTTVFNYTLPTAYTVTGGGGYCTGGVGQHVGLSFGSSGINYTLNGPGGPLVTVGGSGSGVDFGLQTIPGSYSVVAVNPTTGCVNSMTGIATINVSTAPNVYTVMGGGNYCAGGTGQPVYIDHTDIGYTYQLFSGSSPIGLAVPGTGALDSLGTYTTAGTYTVIATSSSAPCTSSMAGSAVININPVPAAYLVIGGGNYCVGGTGAHIILSGSQTGVSYQVYNGGTSGTPEGTLTPGTGSAIDFGLMTDAGSYTIVGVNASLCSSNMTGSTSININPLPNVFNVTGGGDYCAGGTGKHIGLDNSNTGVSYQLYKDGIPTGGTLVGSGAALDYGLKTAAGNYTVIATNVLTSCKDTMDNIIPINIDPLPLINSLAPGGSFCAVGGTGIDIYMPSSESGITYQLYKDGIAVSGADSTGSGISIDFGITTSPGTYTLAATNGATGCNSPMPGSAVVNAVTPPVFTVTGGGNFCAGDTGVHIILTGTTTSDQYQLFNAGTPVGSAITGTGSALDFGLTTTAGTPYTVVATDIALSCVNNMAGSATVGINPLPAADSVTGTGAFCAGSAGVHVGLNTSSTGISYQLYSGTTAVGSAVTGTGSSLDFGLVTSTGTYTAVGTDISTHCASNMANGAVITARPLPTAYRVSIENFGNYCAADSGLHIMLANSDAGIDYQLMRGTTPVGSPVVGTGSAITLGLENVAGTYTIVANDPTTTCSNNMLGSSLLNIIPLPTVYTVTGGGSFCPAGSGVHVGLDGSQDGIFYQLYNGSVSMGTQFGTGAAIDFGLQTAAGTYMVVGNSAITTCPNNMFGTAGVVVDTLGTPVITLRAYPGSGVGVWHIDSMKVFISNGGGPNPTYQWFVNGHTIPGATNQTFTRYELFNNDVVSCAVTGSGPCGGLTTTEAIVIALQNVGVATVSGNSSDVKLVPNPNNGSFSLKGTLGTTVDQEATIEITNMLGQNVYSGKVTAQGGNIDQHIQLGGNLPNGMYLLNLRAGADNMVFHFVIAQ